MTAQAESILDSVKKTIGFDPEFTAFDLDIMMHINMAFNTLQQLGVGPSAGFAIKDNTSKWQEFTGDDVMLNSVQTYISLKVRLIFDPPATSFVIAAYEKVCTEIEWRLNVHGEGVRNS